MADIHWVSAVGVEPYWPPRAVVESGPTKQLLSSPAHPHTRALRDAVPTMGGGLPAVVGQPSGEVAGTGCAYRNRCPFASHRKNQMLKETSTGAR